MESRRSVVARSGFALLMLMAACGRIDDSSSDGLPEPRVLDPDLRIGLVEADPAYLFGDIRSVAADPAGRIYVGDRIDATVRVYDGAGQYIATVAREGRGPGEIYGWPADITVAQDGRLYIRDGSRITILSPSSRGGVADSVATIWPLPGYGNLSSTHSRVGRSGEYYYPGGLFRSDQLPRFFYLPVIDGVMTTDTLEVPPYPGLTGRRRALYRLGTTDGRLLDGLSHVPFAALPVWDVSHAGTILSSDATRYQLIETGTDGDTLRVISGPTSTLRGIPAAERSDSARALDARLDSLPVPIDQVIGLGEGVREHRLPTTLPPLIGIHVATDGAIWIEQWPQEGQGQSRFYDIFDEDGRLRARVVLRSPLERDPPPFFGDRFVVGVVTDSASGVEKVVRFTLPRQPDAPIQR